ncbi:hypothetical protein EJ06DRAFT_352207 [Trichodelitschia bisporula]|uniref:Uncharacterized protein n=1 Tax=Trichodelitschia bisporula TaxID=703511 RepID=A0A6G1I0U9_9PEZI|nr:hypothetical protein EJ06DRAFT_352207 [Trichodelitschia bisporula]
MPASTPPLNPSDVASSLTNAHHTASTTAGTSPPASGAYTGSIDDICACARAAWPAELPSEAWYLAVIPALLAFRRPELIAPVYEYAARVGEDPPQQLVARIKDALMKLWTIIGIPPVISAVPHLARVSPSPSETAESMYTPLTLDAVESRGRGFMQTLYQHNLAQSTGTWGVHEPDFLWLEERVIYGLFLADHSLLGQVETSVVVLAAMMCSGLLAPAEWHVRGMRRLRSRSDRG